MYESIHSISHKLRLLGIHHEAERRCQQALSDSLHPAELVRLLLEDEMQSRGAATAKRLVTQAKFRNRNQLEEWDETFDRGISKAKFKELALLHFFHRGQNLVILGKTGVGKTHLATALGNRICFEAAPTKFYSTHLFLEEALSEKVAGRYLGFIRKITKVKALILDDFGLRTYTHDEATILLEVLEERYAKGILILTSQVAPDGWRALFEDPVIAEAIIDRVMNPCQTFDIQGGSYRKKINLNLTLAEESARKKNERR
jgi:DNA replication protein DnaC